jgi:hypothetical protein
MTNPLWIHRGDRWCVIRAAWPGGRITTLCLDAWGYGLSLIASAKPQQACPACCSELAAGTPGAAEAPAPSRTVTVDLRGASALSADAVKDWGKNER